MQRIVKRMPTWLLIAILVLAGGLWVVSEAHDPVQESQEAIADLTARADMNDSRGLNQGAAIDELFRLVDNLKARVDELAGRANSQSATIDDLYDAIDRINQRGPPSGPDVGE